MSTKAEDTQKNILNTARKHFLKDGLTGASLRNIVKDAGLTTGAFYKYYPTKEALFDALTDPYMEHIYQIYDQIVEEFEKLSASDQTRNMSYTSSDGMERMVDYIYDHYDNFRLLLKCGDSGKFELFIHNMVEREMKSSLNYMEKMKENGAEVHILTALDDIAWMLNIRGNDIPCNPVVLSYLILTETEGHLFIQEATLNDEVKQYLAGLGISIHPYDAVYDFAAGITGKTILLEKAKVNYTICQSVMGENTIVNVMNPASSLKALKTPVEMENIRKAHIKDGVAVTRFVYWLKKNIGKIPMDEVSVAEKLESFRKEQEGYIEPSFGTISAYGPNAAMCHYQATKEDFSVLQPKGMYLVDSGGQYYEGTTDITRTIVVGPLTEEEKEHFTITAMGTLRLGNAKFLHGCIGINLDYLARQAFWERGLDFNHGTGHGVGYLLNVHERPNGFRWKMVPERMENAILEEGMLTSDEPGIYIEGSHGIRTENLMLCRKAEKNMYGQFMRFEFVTMVPIDLDGIDTQYMTEKDVELLNNYHKEVYEKISPYLEGDEKEWLKEATRPISK